MNPVLRHAAAHVFVESLVAPTLSDVDEHHLARVLRVRATDLITVADGSGAWAPASWSSDRGVVVSAEIERSPVRARAEWLTIGCAIPKGDRPELIVQKLTELGIDRIVLFEAARSVVRWDPRKRTANLDRLARVAREAAMQSRRVTLPVIEIRSFADAAVLPTVAIAEPGGRSGWWTSTLGEASVRSVLIGPEGGFTDDELAACPDRVAVASHVLRVETAAIAAGVLMTTAHVGSVS